METVTVWGNDLPYQAPAEASPYKDEADCDGLSWVWGLPQIGGPFSKGSTPKILQFFGTYKEFPPFAEIPGMTYLCFEDLDLGLADCEPCGELLLVELWESRGLKLAASSDECAEVPAKKCLGPARSWRRRFTRSLGPKFRVEGFRVGVFCKDSGVPCKEIKARKHCLNLHNTGFLWFPQVARSTEKGAAME